MKIKTPYNLTSSGTAEYSSRFGDSDPADCLLGFFRATDLSPQQFDGRVRVQENPEESDVFVSYAEFLTRLRSGHLEFIVCDNTGSLYLQFEKIANWWREYYCISHKPNSEAFVMRLVERFVVKAKTGQPQLLQVDWSSNSEDFYWQAFWQGNICINNYCPQILGIPDELFNNMQADFSNCVCDRLPGHRLYISRDVIDD